MNTNEGMVQLSLDDFLAAIAARIADVSEQEEAELGLKALAVASDLFKQLTLDGVTYDALDADETEHECVKLIAIALYLARQIDRISAVADALAAICSEHETVGDLLAADEFHA